MFCLLLWLKAQCRNGHHSVAASDAARSTLWVSLSETRTWISRVTINAVLSRERWRMLTVMSQDLSMTWVCASCPAFFEPGSRAPFSGMTLRRYSHVVFVITTTKKRELCNWKCNLRYFSPLKRQLFLDFPTECVWKPWDSGFLLFCFHLSSF